MLKHHFHQRNRLIAILGQVLFVVEAKRKSGSLITAKYAMDYGKDVLILPSSPMEENKVGTLDLLFDGALPIRDDIDLIQYLRPNLTNAVNSDYYKYEIGKP
jgi:DNA processing protein